MESPKDRISQYIDNFMKVWLVSLVVFVLLASTPTLFADGKLWMQNTAPTALLLIPLLYVCLIAIQKYGKHIGKGQLDDLSSNVQRGGKISGLHFGVLGGLIGVSIGGVLMWISTLTFNECPVYLLALSGALAGLGFGFFTGGNRKLRSLVGCIFGVIAVLFSLMIGYSAPVVVGYSLSSQGEQLSPIYTYNNISFLQFLQSHLFTVTGVFFAYLGLLATTCFGTTVTLRARKHF